MPMEQVVRPMSPYADSVRTFKTQNTVDTFEAHTPLDARAAPDKFQALCRYDFESEDPVNLHFRRGDMLTIVRTESSGWWGAERNGRLGWIPASYVVRLDDSLARTLRDVRDELRFFEYEAESRYRDAPVRNLANPLFTLDDDSPSPLESVPSTSTLFPAYESPPLVNDGYQRRRSFDGYAPDTEDSESETSPMTDVSPVYVQQRPYDQRQYGGRLGVPESIDKPTPPIPTALPDQVDLTTAMQPRQISDTEMYQSRDPGPSNPRPAPTPITTNGHSQHQQEYNDDFFSDGEDFPSPWSAKKAGKRGESKINEILGDRDAQAYYNAKVAQAAQPWYMQPVHVGEEIRMEVDDIIKAGTIEALIERLTIDYLRPEEEKKYRRTFLITFKSFTSADKLFDSLVSQYYMEPPPGLNPKEEREWADKKNRPTQKRILQVLMEWLEQYGMIEDDPHLVPQLQQFLLRINDSPMLALSAKHISQSLERALHPPPESSAPPQRAHRSHQKWRQKTDILHVDVTDLAQQLTLYESRLFMKIRPQECLAWSKVTKGPAVSNLQAFYNSHIRLAAWVKYSILSKEALGRRSDTVDKWIRVAEKCRAVNNINAMCTIVAALGATVIERLHLTWAHVEKKNQLAPLQRIVTPTGNYRECRDTLRVVAENGNPCVPFIAMFLTELTHIAEQHTDIFSVPPSNAYPQGLSLINFAKRRTSTQVIDEIMKHQARTYQFPEKPHLLTFIEEQLKISEKDEAWFWQKTQELQQAEVAHADIKRNLEAAGF